MSTSRGVIYVATGEKYFEEAAISARSVKGSSPNLSITVFTDLDRSKQSPFDRVVTIENPTYPYLGRIKCLQKTPYERTLFLDSDTFVSDDIQSLFALLDRFDFAAAHAPIRVAEGEGTVHAGYPIEGVPEAFPEMNGGVLLYRNSEETRQMIADWETRYEQVVTEIGETRSDQPALRKSLYENPVQFTVLPPEYNFRLPFASYVYGTVKILHGRIPNPEKAAPDINESIGPRVYIPGVGSIGQRSFIIRLLKKFQSLKNKCIAE